jgi:y4mF family transcriptional regulator
MTTVRTLHDLASLIRGRRLAMGLSQNALARAAGVSRKWVYEFEAGNPGAEIGNVLTVLATLGVVLDADVAAPEVDGRSLVALLDDSGRR